MRHVAWAAAALLALAGCGGAEEPPEACLEALEAAEDLTATDTMILLTVFDALEAVTQEDLASLTRANDDLETWEGPRDVAEERYKDAAARCRGLVD